MKKTVCIYPEDLTTDFLLPLYDHVCNNLHAIGIHTDTTDDDDSLDKIYEEIKDAEVVVFLGHGTSKMLYGSRCDNVVFEEANHELLHNKRLLLLSCNSNQFVHNYGLEHSIGFGFLPTSLDDVRQTRKLHEICVEDLDKKDVDCFNASLVQAFISTMSDETMFNFRLFKERLKFNISKEIVQCLMKRETPNFRTVVDELYYVYKDMIIK